ncbi:MAG: hypothetical protein WC870_02290 [Candidatus Paceibacterota bacterium]
MEKIITVDRSTSFDPSLFFGQEGWSTSDGDEDGRALNLTEVDLERIEFEAISFKKNETSISGEKWLRRLKKTGNILLDAKFLEAIKKDTSVIPTSWKKKLKGRPGAPCTVAFPGVVLVCPQGGRFVLTLMWYKGEWDINPLGLAGDWEAVDFAAVLPRVN